MLTALTRTEVSDAAVALRLKSGERSVDDVGKIRDLRPLEHGLPTAAIHVSLFPEILPRSLSRK